MTDRNKFEQMLEHLINEDSDKAKELFHQLVVEKSREIYENILAEDFEDLDEETDDDEMDEAKKDDDEDQVDESDNSDDDEMDESFGFAEGEDEDDTGDIGGDAGDDFIDDIDAEGDEEGSEGEGDLEDRVVDLEDALDDLRSEFEALMSDEEGGGMDDMGGDEFGGDEFGGDMEDEPKMENDVDAFMREYVEKVGNPKHGDNGANTKSTLAGKNDMGGTTANIVKGGESTTGGTKGGLLNPSTKEENAGNINVPGGNAGKTAFKKKEPGHGAEKKGTGDNGDRGADSPINGVRSRAK
jgi:hypothetical protein